MVKEKFEAERPLSYAEARADARSRAAARLGITSPFLRVGEIAKILSLSANAARDQMREGRFPIPHRRLGKVLIVKLDDFLDWYCDDTADDEVGNLPTGVIKGALPKKTVEFISSNDKESPIDRVNRIKNEMKELADPRVCRRQKIGVSRT